MEQRLYDAAREGNESILQELLITAPTILNRPFILGTYAETPLHIAAVFGHVKFARAILNINYKLATEVDIDKSTPLHLASATNNLEMVMLLFNASPEMCLLYDKRGRNPVHIAAVRGQIDVLKWLLHVKPDAVHTQTTQGDSILHQCVKYNQVEAMMMLVENFGDDELVDAKDYEGNTVLHLAVLYKQSEAVKFLLKKNSGIKVNDVNSNKQTALDMLYMKNEDSIGLTLLHHGATLHSNIPTKSQQSEPLQQEQQSYTLMNFIKEKQEAVMIAASLIAAACFQAGVNPPGGIWQDTVRGNETFLTPHQAGTSIIAYGNAALYRRFLVENTIGLVASLSAFLLLLTGLPYKYEFFKRAFMVSIWMAIVAVAASYFSSIITVAPPIEHSKVLGFAVFGLVMSVIAWVMVILWYLGVGPRVVKWMEGWRRANAQPMV